MINIADICIAPDTCIGDAMAAIDLGAVKIALIIDDQDCLLGTLSDGDIRRGLLKGKKLSDTILEVYFKTPIVANKETSKEKLLAMCQSHQIDQIPLVDGKNKIIGLHVLNKIILSEKKKNRVVLMVGGLGKRLRPLTNNTPKPMLHVGGRPILQTIVEGFVSSGFTNITMCLGYKSEQIQDFFKDGAQFGAQIDYVVEDKRMGTAGALTLLRQNLQEPFFVMNGDLLTNINYKKMLDFHIEHESDATMCVREYDFEVPFGVVNTENEKIIAIKEKPKHSFYVNAGIYLLNVDCVNLIPDNEYYDMTSLFEDIIIKGKNAVSFPLQEYWLDIGRVSEYQQANDEFHKVF